MTLRDFMKTLTREQKEAFAMRCKTKLSYLQQIAGGHRKASGPLARRMIIESGFMISPQSIRDDIFG